MSFEKLKGTRNFAPEEKILRQGVVDTLKKSFEKYGFSPFETSIIEKQDTLTSKYAGGEEILKEIYKVKDQGDRALALRYDLTVPLAVFIGLNPTIKMPFKRYEIGKVFRDGPIKAGRLREFWQCDVDIIGAKGMLAEAELLTLASEVFKDLGLDVEIKVNNRKLLNGIIEYSGIKENKESAILSIDKLEKFGPKQVKKELVDKGFNDSDVDKVLETFSLKGENDDVLKELKELIKSDEGKVGLAEVEELLGYLKETKSDVTLDISLARGLAYYTGTIYEVFLKDGSFSSALSGGGRWDEMIGKMLESKREYPAVGISFGLEPITEIIKKKKNGKKSVSDVFVIPIKTVKESLVFSKKLRDSGIKVDLDIMGRGISKNLNYVNSAGIPFAVIIGQSEVEKKIVKIKNMVQGEEKEVSIDEAISIIKNG